MTKPDRIPGGATGATEAEANDLVRGLEALFRLDIGAAEGDEGTRSALGILENMGQLNQSILDLEAQQKFEALKRHIPL